MTVLTLVRSELARLVATPLARLALVALMLVPVLYGGLYLWANRDPYAGLENVPAAVVVLDEGATVNGEAVNYGADVARTIQKDAAFQWHRVSAAVAAAGVKNGTYDFAITLPTDFSVDLASAGTADPTRAAIALTTNDTNSYLATTIAKQAAETLRTSIAAQVGERATNEFLLGFADVKSSLETAASAADRLASGVSTTQDGATRLARGTAQLAAGASKVATGTAQLAALGDQARTAADSLAARVPEAEAKLSAALTAQGLDEAQIATVLGQLAPLKTTAASAQSKLDALATQVDQLSTGAAQVSSGAATAHAGATALHSGLGQLATGASSLGNGLREGVAQLPATDASSRARTADAIADPVQVDRTAITQASDYGSGLAPFFLSLSAWIGIYALFLIVKPFSRRALTAVKRPLRVTLAGWLTPGLLGVAQMCAVYAVITFALGFPIAAPIATIGVLALASLTFAAIILALNALLGSVGQFLGLVLMVVQLVTAGGTFPWQTLPGPLAALHHVLPMSAAVDALRQTMYGGAASAAGADALILGGWLVAGLAVTYLAASRMSNRRTLRDLRPSLIG